MELVSLCSLPVAAVVWSTKQRGWSLTVICKATFHLAPGELALAQEQIPIHKSEQRDGASPEGSSEASSSLRAPSDLVPFKPNADVLLVGRAHVSGGREGGSVVAHLKVGAIDKALKVVGDRVKSPSGEIGAASKFHSLPLRYERGVGGPGTDNPVGVPQKGGRLEDGDWRLHNIEPATAADAGVLPAFAPLPESWPTRVAKLGRHAAQWQTHAWYTEPLEIDLGFFNSAPEEQQLEALSSSDAIELENLHAKYPRLVAELPSMCPQVFVERRGEEPERLSMRCDTLWIDTDESLCTMTWRGQHRVDGPREQLRCLVAVSEDGSPMTWDDLERLRASHEWMDRGPDSFGDAIGLRRASEAQNLGRELEVLTPSRSDAPPASTEGSFLSGVDVMSVRGEQVPPLGDPADEGEVVSIVKLLWADPAARGARKEDVDAAELLRLGEPLSSEAIEALVLEAAAIEGPFTPPLALSEGELRASFDELATLRATVLAASPYASGDPRLMGVMEEARAIFASPGHERDRRLRVVGSAAAEDIAVRLRETFLDSQPPVPGNYLDAQVDRMLVEARAYRRRVLWGRRWLRFAFLPHEARIALPTYLPEALASELPMFGAFPARLLAEVDLREDQYETHPLALRVMAVARVEILQR